MRIEPERRWPGTALRAMVAASGVAALLGLAAHPATADPNDPSTTAATTTPATTTPATTTPATTTPATTTPGEGAARVAPGQLTVTVALNCNTYSVEATIENGTAAEVTVGVRVPGGTIFKTLTVAPGATGILRVRGVFSDPYNYEYVRLDTNAVVGSIEGEFFICPSRSDLNIRVVAGSSYTSGSICPAFGFGPRRPAHGTVRVTDDGDGFIYTPDPGFVGADRFDYGCIPSAETFGTVFVTVLAAPPTATPSPPAQPGLPATGVPIRRQLLGAAVLLAVGAATVLLARPRRRRHRAG
jgi:hypothetical protein